MTASLTATYADAHHTYRAAGWPGPLPLPDGKKWPPPEGWTGYAGEYPSPADSYAWTEEPVYATTRQTGLRLADGVIGIDVDHYGDKRGGDTLAEAERRWGPLPDAPYSSARGEGVSGIRFYRVPAGTALRTVIRFPDLDLGHVEVIQRHHRYAVVWPSVHPSTGDDYRWHNTARPDAPPNADRLPHLPDAWLDGLAADGKDSAQGEATPAAVQAFTRDHARGVDPHAVKGVIAVFERALRSGSRHDAMVEAACMAAREARSGRLSAAEAERQLRTRFTLALAGGGAGDRKVSAAEADREFSSVWAWAVGQALPLDPAVLRAEQSARDTRTGQPGAPTGGRVLGRNRTSPLAGGESGHVHVPVAPPAAAPGGPTLPPVDDDHDDDSGDDGGDGEQDGIVPGLTTTSGWQAIDLGPYLEGTITRPEAEIGLARTDGVRLFYAGKEHALIGEMESGKSWIALASVAAELAAGNTVLYVHFEEDDPSDTVERLLLLGCTPRMLRDLFRFIAPSYPITPDVIDALCDVEPSLVILDGQNEAMALHALGIREEDGAAAYRRLLVKPFTAAGAAVVSCDHVTKDSEKSAKGYALGSIHKGNGINGTIVLLENIEPFGIGRRGVSRVFLTKDRPGTLRRHGHATEVARKFELGDVVVDSTEDGAELSLAFHPPRPKDAADAIDVAAAARGWNNPDQAELPNNIVGYRGMGRSAILDLARFVRANGQGGLGVDLPGAKAALLALKDRGQPRHKRDTVERAWGALYDLGRLTPSDANTSGNPKGLMSWVPQPGDPLD